MIAEGWPNQTGPSDWGFDGTLGLNFNTPGDVLTANLQIADSIDACTPPLADLTGQIALI